MAGKQRMAVRTIGIAVAIAGFAALQASPAAAQGTAPITMKLSTATVNDTQHEWLKRFAAAVEKDSGGRIKAEVYPASQLGAIPRQIEGVQFASIQGWTGPPEFLVGVDERYETMSAPGLFTSREQYERTVKDPAVTGLILGLGANKGLVGAGIYPIGPSSIITRKQIQHLSDYAGLKIRVLASPFQLELIKRMGGSPVAMTLADVLAGAAAGRHRRLAHHHDPVHDLALYRRGEVRRRDRPALCQLYYRSEQEVGRRLAGRSAEDRPRRRDENLGGHRAVCRPVLRRAAPGLEGFRRQRRSTCPRRIRWRCWPRFPASPRICRRRSRT